jgi:hypothetical protein
MSGAVELRAHRGTPPQPTLDVRIREGHQPVGVGYPLAK